MQHIVKGRASICTWSLSVMFLTKEQAIGAVKDILDEEIPFNVKYYMDIQETREVYILEIESFAWAENLKTIAKILKKHDHSID